MHHPYTLTQIAVACRQLGIPVARFGREAVGDPCLVRDLRNGRKLRSSTIERIHSYIDRMQAQGQPGAEQVAEAPLRPFIVYAATPVGCVAVTIPDDRSTPHVRRGEVVAADPTQREPIEGDLFVIGWNSGKAQVVELRCRRLRVHPRDGSPPEDRDCWFVEWHMPTLRIDGTASEPQRWCDGPYNEAGLASKLVGRVVGLIEPDNKFAIREARKLPQEPSFYEHSRMMREGSEKLLAAVLSSKGEC